ncbi:hypothetical protein QFC22_005498 [Naganishia vaughanmartiniae]|uniref:Uncharacterized protein n=1 Tax=Naganishia vaughanmartiniae TaxID=1424756 RepID=A0ACC2WS75_9TREE|nr:hypothetical protein QFC22_005498 [Naganishia vaughanmartiniae]
MSPPQPTVTNTSEEQDIDDLDDLDDLLDDFAAPPKQPQPHVKQPTSDDSKLPSSTSFEDELSRNMAALFASLGSPPLAAPSAGSPTTAGNGQAQDMLNDKESLELQELFQQLMKSDPALAGASGEGGLGGLSDGGMGGEESLDALLASLTGSLANPPPPPPPPPSTEPQAQAKPKTNNQPAASSPSAPASTSNNGKTKPPSTSSNGGSSAAGAGKLSFEDTIKQTMNNMKASEQESRNGGGKQDASLLSFPLFLANDPLAALLASLNIDPTDLDLASLNIPGLSAGAGGLGGMGEGGPGGEDFSGLLDGMMKQLMTREILEEPLVELSEKYPPYLLAHKSSLPAAQYDKYAEQSGIVTRIVEIFGKEGYSDDDSAMRSEVTTLMTKMQDLGSPPDEIMGDMPEGLDFGGGEACSIM